jgi:hypothetical protein
MNENTAFEREIYLPRYVSRFALFNLNQLTVQEDNFDTVNNDIIFVP